MFVLLSAFLLFVAGGWGDVEVRLPIFLHGRRKFVEVGEQHGDLPHVGLGESFIPGGHAGIANAGAGISASTLSVEISKSGSSR